MLMDPFPNNGKAYSLLVKQERRTIFSTDESKLLTILGNHFLSSHVSGIGSTPRGRGDRGGR